MKSYLRFLSKNKLYIAVEVIGTSIAFAFAIPLLSFLGDKRSIDRGHNYKNIYAVCPIGTFETTAGLGPAISETVPEVEQYAQVYACPDNVVSFDGVHLQASCLAASTGLFDLFDIRLHRGMSSSLADRHNVLISESFASKLGLNPIGKSFVLAKEEYSIVGIFDDFHNSLLPVTDIIVSINSPVMDKQWKQPDAYWSDIYTLVQVSRGTKKKDLSEQCRKVCEEYYSAYYSQYPDNKRSIRIIRYDNISSNYNNRDLTRTWGLSLWAVEFFSVILLVFAVLNYVNLTVALSLKRGKEWSMKKLLGLSGIGVAVSLFAETFSITVFCFFSAYALSCIIVPYFNDFFLATNTFIELNSSITLEKCLVFFIFVVTLSAIAAIIPAWVCRRYSPADVVSGKYRTAVKGGTGSFLIGIQCFLIIILLSVSTLLFSQYKMMTGRPRGQVDDNVFVISGDYTAHLQTSVSDMM